MKGSFVFFGCAFYQIRSCDDDAVVKFDRGTHLKKVGKAQNRKNRSEVVMDLNISPEKQAGISAVIFRLPATVIHFHFQVITKNRSPFGALLYDVKFARILSKQKEEC